MTRAQAIAAAQEQITAAQADVSVLVKCVGQVAPVFAYRAREQVISASVIKVPILLAALEQVQRGALALDTLIAVPQQEILSDTHVFVFGSRAYTLRELLTWMIVNSDNTATNVLIENLGMDCINAYIARMGLAQTHLARKMLDWPAVAAGKNNYTSAQDMAVLFDALYAHTILSPMLCDTALDILKQQRSFELLLRYIWQPVPVAHKTGGLDHLCHDVGVFEMPRGCYYIGVFIWNTPHIDGDEALAGRLSKIFYEMFEEEWA